MPLKLFIYNNNKAFECKGQEEAIEDYKLWGWCALENFGSFTFLVRLPVAVAKMGKCQNVRLGAWGWECLMLALYFIFVANGFLVTICMLAMAAIPKH